MAAYFLLLYAGVGLIQEKRFFGSAPKENLDAIPDRKPERFPGAHILGWTLGVFRPVRGHALPGGAVRHCLFRPFLPGIEGHRRTHQFGYNKKVHALHFALYLPVSVLLAWVCTLL